MISCKLCRTELERKHLRKDGSLLCPVCGQVYWRAAVEKAMAAEGRSRQRVAVPRPGRHVVRTGIA
ncbi:MAG: hypothetical protein K6C08_15075 [Oscillospiraceae bacterium]|nr:hypothetical protein [Oscillospiraceae bacterium]